MLFFVAERPDDSVAEQLLEGVTGELAARGVEHGVVLLVGGGGQVRNLFALRQACGGDEDIWLLGDGLSPSANLLKHFPGRKYAFLSHVPDRPSTSKGSGLAVQELAFLNAIFVDDGWVRHRLLSVAPRLASRVVVSGFPLDVEHVRSQGLQTQIGDRGHRPDVVSVEPFGPGFAHILKVELARELRGCGLTMQQLVRGTRDEFLNNADLETRRLFQLAEAVGLDFTFCATDSTYYGSVAEARCLLSMALVYDRQRVTEALQAMCLGVSVLAPESDRARYYLPLHTYRPFNLRDIVAHVQSIAAQGEAPGEHHEALHHLFSLHSKKGAIDRVMTRISAEVAASLPRDSVERMRLTSANGLWPLTSRSDGAKDAVRGRSVPHSSLRISHTIAWGEP